jgi:plastocyanin
VLGKLGFRLALVTGLVAAVAIVAPLTSGAAGIEHTVNVSDFQFGDGPDGNILSIEAGDTVVWHVRQGSHTITPDVAGSFTGSDGPRNVDEKHGPIAFDTPGDYPYHCDIHPTLMTGVIRVAAPPTTTTTQPPTTTTTTTRPPASSTTTTTRVTTTTTTPPATTPTTSTPGPTTTTPPPTVAAAGPPPTPTTAPPAPTTTTKPKGKGKGTTTTTSKPRKSADGKGGTPAQPPATPPGEQPPAEIPGGDFPRLGSGDVPAGEPGAENPAPETGSEEQATPIAKRDKALDRNGTRLLLGTAIVVTLLGLGVLGYKWRTRDSQYWAA